MNRGPQICSETTYKEGGEEFTRFTRKCSLLDLELDCRIGNTEGIALQRGQVRIGGW